MRQSNIVWVIGILLIFSVSFNIVLVSQRLFPHVAKTALDYRLVGTWKSRNPHGYRVVFLHSGEFIVTNYGTPYGRPGSWSARDGKLTILWGFDEEGEVGAPKTTTVSFRESDTVLELGDDLFSPSATTFVRASGEP